MKIKLNKDLLKKNKVKKKQIKQIYKLHFYLNDIHEFADMLNKDGKLNRTNGRLISKHLKDIEFQLQENWNFEKNEDFHKYQQTLEGCTCPILDNKDYYGTPISIIHIDCPYHT